MHITPHPSKPLVWWYNRKPLIDMSPSYQRKGRLWSTSDKAYLIDSIINGFDVPKLYLADFQLGESPLNTKKLPYAIIDGKQRLEAIFDFFEHNLVLNNDFVWRQARHLKLGGLSLKDLKASYPVVAEAFETETIDIMSVVTNDEEDISELFVRLNRSKPLTGAEIRNAMTGPVADLIRNISKHPFFQENIKFSVQRAGDYNAATKLVLFEFENKPMSTKKKDLDFFTGNKKVDQSKLELAARRTLDILDNMQEVFLPRDDLLSSAGPVPVYYWLVRQTDLQSHVSLREFLVAFEFLRKKNRDEQMKGDAAEGEKIFSRYDTLNRSVNDVGSHVGRFDILHELFISWLKEKPPNKESEFTLKI
jgi:hypothetical protein